MAADQALCTRSVHPLARTESPVHVELSLVLTHVTAAVAIFMPTSALTMSTTPITSLMIAIKVMALHAAFLHAISTRQFFLTEGEFAFLSHHDYGIAVLATLRAQGVARCPGEGCKNHTGNADPHGK